MATRTPSELKVLSALRYSDVTTIYYFHRSFKKLQETFQNFVNNSGYYR